MLATTGTSTSDPDGPTAELVLPDEGVARATPAGGPFTRHAARTHGANNASTTIGKKGEDPRRDAVAFAFNRAAAGFTAPRIERNQCRVLAVGGTRQEVWPQEALLARAVFEILGTTVRAGGSMATATRPAAYDQALALFRDNRFPEALTLLEQCVHEQPEHIGSRFGLAVCLARLGQSERSVHLLQEVIAAAPDHHPARLELIRSLRATDRLAEAAEQCQNLLQHDPSNAAARYELVACQLELRKQEAPLAEDHTAPAPESKTEAVHKRLPSLAALLDAGDELPSPTELGGQQEFKGRRPIYSFARLPIAVVLILIAPPVAASLRSLTLNSDEYYVLLPWDIVPLATFLDDVVDFLILGLIAVGSLLIVSALLSSLLTRYVVRQRRLEVTQGVWRRSRRIVWYFDVTEVRFQQTPLLAIFGTGRLMIRSEKGASIDATLPGSGRSSARSKESVLYIVGASSARALRLLQDQMYQSAWYERRAMKKTFI